jgi:hypothetical protein
LNWIESEAENKQILLRKVRDSLSGFEEPDDYRTDSAWSDGSGVLLAVE